MCLSQWDPSHPQWPLTHVDTWDQQTGVVYFISCLGLGYNSHHRRLLTFSASIQNFISSYFKVKYEMNGVFSNKTVICVLVMAAELVLSTEENYMLAICWCPLLSHLCCQLKGWSRCLFSLVVYIFKECLRITFTTGGNIFLIPMLCLTN